MRGLPKGTSPALRAELAKMTKQDAVSDASRVIMAESIIVELDPAMPAEMGWRSNTLVGEGPQETPEQAHYSAVKLAAEAMVGHTPRALEVTHSGAHSFAAAVRDTSFRSAEKRLQLSVDKATQPKTE